MDLTPSLSSLLGESPFDRLIPTGRKGSRIRKKIGAVQEEIERHVHPSVPGPNFYDGTQFWPGIGPDHTKTNYTAIGAPWTAAVGTGCDLDLTVIDGSPGNFVAQGIVEPTNLAAQGLLDNNWRRFSALKVEAATVDNLVVRFGQGNKPGPTNAAGLWITNQFAFLPVAWAGTGTIELFTTRGKIFTIAVDNGLANCDGEPLPLSQWRFLHGWAQGYGGGEDLIRVTGGPALLVTFALMLVYQAAGQIERGIWLGDRGRPWDDA